MNLWSNDVNNCYNSYTSTRTRLVWLSAVKWMRTIQRCSESLSQRFHKKQTPAKRGTHFYAHRPCEVYFGPAWMSLVVGRAWSARHVQKTAAVNLNPMWALRAISHANVNRGDTRPPPWAVSEISPPTNKPRTRFAHQPLRRNVSCSVCLLACFLYEVSASAYEISKQRVCGCGWGASQRITVSPQRCDWATGVSFLLLFFFKRRGGGVCLCCSTLSQY